MSKPNYENARFLLSIADLHQLPSDEGIEIAFVGRSNAGKSSVLNLLTHQKNLARVSKTPGRTQHINLFALDAKRRIADLPGYGYAKVPVAIKKKWEALLDQYLSSRACLKGLVLIMDIRHPQKTFDQHLLTWSEQCQLPLHIVLNKSDKLTPAVARKTAESLKKSIRTYTQPITVQLFSALKGEGVEALRKLLDAWFKNPHPS